MAISFLLGTCEYKCLFEGNMMRNMETFLEGQETGNKKNNLFTVSKVESGGDSGFSKD